MIFKFKCTGRLKLIYFLVSLIGCLIYEDPEPYFEAYYSPKQGGVVLLTHTEFLKFLDNNILIEIFSLFKKSF